MVTILPAIIGRDFAEVTEKLHELEEVTDWAHLDVMDGSFTAQESWREPTDLANLNGKTKLETHLMILEPEVALRHWLTVVDRILVHIEATHYLEEIIDSFSAHPIGVGVVLNLETPLEAIKAMPKSVELVQLMSIAKIGRQGYHFEERVFEKIKLLREYRPDVKIQVDGGVNLENASRLIEAGVDNLVIGSAIWQTKDPLASIAAFRKLSHSNQKAGS